MHSNNDFEVWKEFDTKLTGSYGLLVSNFGNFKNINLVDKKISDNGAGYKFVTVYHKVDGKGRSKHFYVHRLVASLFCHNPNHEEFTQVNHKDGDKSNNHYSNLEWVSPSSNIQHSHKEGLSMARRKHGALNSVGKLRASWAYYQVKFAGRGIAEMANELRIPRTTLSSIINKRCRVNLTDKVDVIGAKYGGGLGKESLWDYI